MDILPVARALRRRKLGAVLIALQMVLSVAILANAIHIVQQRLQHMQRPTGLDEAGLFSINNSFTGPTADLAARIQGDLAQLRAIPGVVDAAAMFGLPLGGFGQATSVALAKDQHEPSAIAAEYAATDRSMRVLGFSIVAGRPFSAAEVGDFEAAADAPLGMPVIVSQALASRLFPEGDALGKHIYIGYPAPCRIVGIVARAQAPWAASDEGTGIFATGSENSVFLPQQVVRAELTYVIRTQPGRRDALLGVAQQRLYAFSRARVLSDAQTFPEMRAKQYRSDRSMALILIVVCALMLAVAALGVIAMTTYWVAQRRRQIGLRRALGASRLDIAAYFHTENLLIAGAGAIGGVALGYGVNLWLVANEGIAAVGGDYLLVAAIIVLGLSQLAVLWPAYRAASAPPSQATRGL